jgi:hypothetical protein
MADLALLESDDRPRYIRSDIYNHAEDLRRKARRLTRIADLRPSTGLAKRLREHVVTLLAMADALDVSAEQEPEDDFHDLPFG